MPVIDTQFNDKTDPFEKLQKVLKVIGTSDIDGCFVDKDGHRVITRDYLEMIIGQFAQQAQNPQMFNKWIALDTKLDKALREFKSDLRILISGQSQINQAQTELGSQAPTPPEAPTPTPPEEAAKELPTE